MPASLQDIQKAFDTKSAIDIGKDYYGSTKVGFVGDTANIGGKTFSSANDLYNAVFGGGASTSPAPGGMSSSGGDRTAYFNAQAEKLKSDINANNQSRTAAQQKLIDYYAGLEDPTTRYKNILAEQGVSEQQDLVNALTRDVMNTQDLIEGVDESVATRSKDFLMTDADRTALTAREQDPLVKNLTKLLRSKEYEEVGLAGKQALARELLQLSLQADEMGAKPLQLGVDFTTADVKEANTLLQNLFSSNITAFNQDVTSAENRAAEERAAQRANDAADLAFERQKEMAKLSSSLSLSNSLALKNATAKDTAKSEKTADVWNSILSRSDNEYDIWNQIDKNQDAYRSAGVDVDTLWKMHNELAGKVGVGGSVRSNSPSYEELIGLIAGG